LKDLIIFIKDHLIYFSKKSFLIPLLIFLGVIIFLSYYFDIESIILQANMNKFERMVIYLLLYGFGYYSTVFWYGFMYKTPKVISPPFLISSFILLIILAIDKTILLHSLLAENLSTYPFVYFTSRLFKLLTLPVMTVIVSLLLAGIMNFKFKNTGLTYNNLKIMPFIYLLSGTLLLVVAASFTQGFQNYYPMYKTTLASKATNIPEYIFILLFESTYGLNLLSVEVIFRGILTISFIRFLGKGSIFPMVTVYCFIHFGKPVIECISSIFGGYLLGVIALYTRSIIGGSILHIGLAWQMEVIAWIQELND